MDVFYGVLCWRDRRNEIAKRQRCQQLCIVLAHFAHFWWISDGVLQKDWLPRLDLNQ